MLGAGCGLIFGDEKTVCRDLAACVAGDELELRRAGAIGEIQKPQASLARGTVEAASFGNGAEFVMVFALVFRGFDEPEMLGDFHHLRLGEGDRRGVNRGLLCYGLHKCEVLG